MALNISPSILDATYTTFDLRYQQGITRANPWSEQIATTVSSAAGSNTYAWLKSIPAFREWVGERVLHSLVSRGTVLPNKDWEQTLTVPRNSIEDEQIGIFNAMFEMMGREAAKWPDVVLAKALKAGGTAIHYDGQPFFNASHPVDPDDSSKGTYSNDRTTFDLTPDNYAAARADFLGRVNDHGNPMGLIPDLLIVPPQLETTAKRILESDLIARAVGASAAAADTNVNKGTAKWLMIPELADEPTRWYLACTSLPIKPLIWQLRMAPRMFPQIAPTDPNVLYHKEYHYLADARGNAGYTFPFLITRCTA